MCREDGGDVVLNFGDGTPLLQPKQPNPVIASEYRPSKLSFVDFADDGGTEENSGVLELQFSKNIAAGVEVEAVSQLHKAAYGQAEETSTFNVEQSLSDPFKDKVSSSGEDTPEE